MKYQIKSATRAHPIGDPRHKLLPLLAYEINRLAITGSVAELGVYRGDFAVVLNAAFHDRILYLFDTFCGFDVAQVAADTKHKLLCGPYNYRTVFSDTSSRGVLKRMSYPSKCVIVDGVFPGTMAKISNLERFCLVSIDCDLYVPTLHALELFYDRLSNGGYIILHDYNNAEWKGVSKAFDEVYKKRRFKFVPVDNIGVVITK